MGFLLVFLSAVSGAAFGQSYKWKIRLGLDTDVVLVWFSLTGSVVLGITASFLPPPEITTALVITALVYALAMTIAMYAYYYTIASAKLGVSWTIIQLSVIIPFLTSVLFYGEHLTPGAIAGLVVILASIVVFGLRRARPQSDEAGSPDPDSRPPEDSRRRPAVASVVALVLASLFTGVNAASVRVFKSVSPGIASIPFFLLIAFVAMLAITALRLVTRPRAVRRAFLDPRVALFGAFKSVTNLTAMALLMLALERMAGSFVFPVRTPLNILVVLLVSVVIYREQIRRNEIAGTILAIAGIAILTAASS